MKRLHPACRHCWTQAIGKPLTRHATGRIKFVKQANGSGAHRNITSTFQGASSVYDRERDCPEGLCVTEAIKKYAGQLAEARLDTRQRWEAFAWLCHLVGDLHQPLHTGYKDDRGGNYYEIIFQGQASDLHQFWDRILIRERLGRNGTWKVPALDDREVITGNEWNPSETDTWTSESHALVKQAAYPPTEHIQADFADQSWLLIQQQWLRAGNRLARIINASIGEGEVVICRDDGKENGTGK